MRLGLAAAAAASMALAAPGAALAANAKLNGFWFVDADQRLDAMAAVHAELTPKGEEAAKANADHEAERRARGEYVNVNAAICGNIGVPFIIGTSEPWLLSVSDTVVLQTAERYQLTPRYFYTDGRDWPDFSKLPPSSSGYSIAHWDGDDLVIETRDLPPGGIQGGGLKGPNSVLTERVSLSPDGDRLTWTYSWNDPELLAKPYSYSVEYYRGPPDTYAMFQFCDPNLEPSRMVEVPPQTEGAAQ